MVEDKAFDLRLNNCIIFARLPSSLGISEDRLFECSSNIFSIFTIPPSSVGIAVLRAL